MLCVTLRDNEHVTPVDRVRVGDDEDPVACCDHVEGARSDSVTEKAVNSHSPVGPRPASARHRYPVTGWESAWRRAVPTARI